MARKKQVVDCHHLAGLEPAERAPRRSGSNQRGSDRGTGQPDAGGHRGHRRQGARTSSPPVPYQQAGNATFRFQDQTTSRRQITGTSSKFPLVRDWPVAQGTFFERGG